MKNALHKVLEEILPSEDDRKGYSKSRNDREGNYPHAIEREISGEAKFSLEFVTLRMSLCETST